MASKPRARAGLGEDFTKIANVPLSDFKALSQDRRIILRHNRFQRAFWHRRIMQTAICGWSRDVIVELAGFLVQHDPGDASRYGRRHDLAHELPLLEFAGHFNSSTWRGCTLR